MRLRRKKSPPIANLATAFLGGIALGGVVVGGVMMALSPSRRSRREEASRRDESLTDAQSSESLDHAGAASYREPESASSGRSRVRHHS